MLEQAYFPMCCTLRIFGGFGETVNCDHIADHYWDNGYNEVEIREEIDDIIDQARKGRQAAVVCTTNNEQVKTNALLENMGFSRTPFMSKELHPNTKVAFWWKALND